MLRKDRSKIPGQKWKEYRGARGEGGREWSWICAVKRHEETLPSERKWRKVVVLKVKEGAGGEKGKRDS